MPLQLIVGLGNPGSKYAFTRHNAGFWLVEAIARQHGASFSAEKRFSGEVCKINVANQPIWLLKPMTFMNRSGLAVRQMMDFYRISIDQVLVVHDELDIPAGQIRLKQAGGHGGHNGLRDIHAHTSPEYWRLRVGVGHPGDRNEVLNYVLAPPGRDDGIVIGNAIDAAVALLEPIVQGDMQKVMQYLHSR